MSVGDADTSWPVTLRGVTETVVTTLGPDGRWNAAALGVHAPEAKADGGALATARTWGETRTRKNFGRHGEGYVQFTRDAEAFARAALTIDEHEDPILPSADAWVRVAVDAVDTGSEGETTWIEWALDPTAATVEVHSVPTTNRGFGAVVEAAVAASRLSVPGYDREHLVARLEYFEDVIETCGGPAEQRALGVVREATDW